jgi:hypothetical protein
MSSWAISTSSSQTSFGGEVAEGQLLEAGLLGGADAVLDARAGAVAPFERGDVGRWLIGEDDLEAMALVVGERELGAGVGALAADDQPAPGRPGREIHPVGELGHRPVLALGAA